MRRIRALVLMGVVVLAAGCAPQPGKLMVTASVQQSTQPANPQVVQNIETAFAKLDHQAFRAVSLAQAGDNVLVVGAVVRPDQRRMVEQKIAAVPGVGRVINAIIVTDEAALETYRPNGSKERDLAAKVPAGVAVRVVHNVVYAVGVATAQDLDHFKEIVAQDGDLMWVDAGGVRLR